MAEMMIWFDVIATYHIAKGSPVNETGQRQFGAVLAAACLSGRNFRKE